MIYVPKACVEVIDVEEGVDFDLPHADTVLLCEPREEEYYDKKTERYAKKAFIRLWILHRPGL